MYLPESRVKELLDLIRWVHTDTPWNDPKRFFHILHRVIPFDYSITFMKMDPRSCKVLPSHLTLSNGGGDDAAVTRDYNDYFWQFKKPILSRIMKRRLQTFHIPDSVTTYLPKVQAQEFQWDFWKKHRVQFCYAQYMKTSQGWLGFYLSRYPGGRDFSEEERLCLDLLTPHLELAATHNTSEAACFFVDLKGQMVAMDAQVEALLKEKASLARRLRTSLPCWILQVLAAPFDPFQRDIREGGDVYRLTLSPAGIGRSCLFRLSLIQLREQSLLPAGVLEAFARRFRLSHREQDILFCVISGKQMKEMAQQLGLAVDTVKEYLGSLYRKVGVDGRGPLLALVFSEVSKGFSLQDSALVHAGRSQDSAIA